MPRSGPAVVCAGEPASALVAAVLAAICLAIATPSRAASITVTASHPTDSVARADLSSLSAAGASRSISLSLASSVLEASQTSAISVFPPSAVLATGWAPSGSIGPIAGGFELGCCGADPSNDSPKLPLLSPSALGPSP